jgi:hypothetical protein
MWLSIGPYARVAKEAKSLPCLHCKVMCKFGNQSKRHATRRQLTWGFEGMAASWALFLTRSFKSVQGPFPEPGWERMVGRRQTAGEERL